MKLNIEWNENLVTARTHAKILKLINREAMEFHRDITLFRHFKPDAMRRYSAVYKKRSKKYMQRKARVYRTQDPLVYSGHLKAVITQTSNVTSTQYGARLYARSYFLLTAERRAEIEYVSADEQREMAERIQRRYAQECRKPENMRKRRVKISRGP
jgi:hypothetical protein